MTILFRSAYVENQCHLKQLNEDNVEFKSRYQQVCYKLDKQTEEYVECKSRLKQLSKELVHMKYSQVPIILSLHFFVFTNYST